MSETTRTTKAVTVQDGDGNDYELIECECDNTHEQNNTVCRYCYALKPKPKQKKPITTD